MVKFFSRLLQSLASRRSQRMSTRRSRQAEFAARAIEFCNLKSSGGYASRRSKAVGTRLQSMDRLETRTLLAATLNGLADGRVIYSGTAVANNLTVDFNGTNYSFSDSGETITLAGTLVGIGAGSGTNTVTFDPSLLASFTFFNVNTSTGNDTITINGFRGQEGLTVQNNVGDGTDVLNINANLGSVGSRLTAPVQLLSETLNLGGSIFTNNQTVTLSGANAAINLTAGVTVDAGTGTVSSTSTINGANSLTVQAGSVQLSGIIGGTTPLTNVALTATGALQVPAITVTGDVTTSAGAAGTSLRGNITAGDDITITSATTTLTVAPITLATNGAAGNDINITGAVSGTQSLGLNAGIGGNIIVGGNIGLTGAAVLLAAGSSIDFNGSTSANSGINLTTTAGLFARSLTASAGPIFVAGDVTFDGAGAVTNTAGTTQSMDFTGNITGNGSDLNLRGAQTFSVNGSITNVATLSIAKGVGTATDVTINNATSQTIQIAATNIHARGDLTATVQNIALTGAVILDGADPTVTLTSGLGIGDSIIITGTVDDAGAPTAWELIAGNDTTVATDGSVTVTGIIGGTTPIQSLRANGSIVSLQAVTVSTGDILLGGGEISLNGSLSGTGGNNSVIFATNGVGGTLQVHNTPTSPPSSNMTVDATDLAQLTASIENMVFGSDSTATVILFPDANTSQVTGNFVLTRNAEFRASTVTLNESIDQNSFTVSSFANTLNVNLPLVDVGAVTLTKLTPGGTFVINGNLGSGGWGANALTINNVTGDVTVNGHLGGIPLASLTVNSVTLDTSSQLSAIEANGDATLNVTTFNGNGGVYSTIGNVFIGGDVVSNSGPLTFLVPSGNTLQINGTVDAVGNITVRGRGGAIASVNIAGEVNTTGYFTIDSSGASTAAAVALNGVTASSIVVRGVGITLNSDLTTTAGSVHLLGNVTLGNDVVMTSSGQATHFVRVDGDINGAFNLEAQSGLGRTHLVGRVGNTTPLNNLLVRSGGFNYIYDHIIVNGTVDWLVGDTANAGQDQLRFFSGSTMTAGSSITLEADTVIVNQVTQLFAPTETVISNGGA